MSSQNATGVHFESKRSLLLHFWQNAKRKTQNAKRCTSKKAKRKTQLKRKTQMQKMQNAQRKMHETQNAQNARRSFKMQSQNAKTP